ncbi:MAG: hypothetical protein K0M40_01125 [Prolixibacteraceae bacterium]|nr:hypothetical protein [Prolixibacteraceae bacterium]
MMQFRKQIILSVIFQLSVLVYPMVVKGLHHHEYHECHHECDHETFTDKTEHCAICDYEFVKAIVPELVQFSYVVTSFPAPKPKFNQFIFTEVFPYYSLRAPPSV